MDSNVFITLSKYNSANDENYLTEAFVFLLKTLLEKDRQVCLNILDLLCVKESDFSFSADENILIETQISIEQGRPDIKISTPNKLIYIEVKHNSDLGDRQMERYKESLDLSDASIKKLILLTKFSLDFDEQEKPYKHVQWWQIYNWLSDVKPGQQVSIYLIRAFLEFLEVKKMSIQKVSWEYINGISAFKNLINMIRVAIESASLTVYKLSAGKDWYGFYINNNEILCVIYYDNPLLLKFEVWKDNKDKIYSSSLNFESIYFFCLDKDAQLQHISNFIKECYKKTKEQLPQLKNG